MAEVDYRPKRRPLDFIDSHIDVEKRIRALETGAHPVRALDGGAGMSTGWYTMTPNLLNGHAAGVRAPKWRTHADMVFMRGVLDATNSTANHFYTLLDPDFWPSDRIDFGVEVEAGTALKRLRVDPDGKLYLLDRPSIVRLENVVYPLA